MVVRAGDALARAVFPHFCAGCGSEGMIICQKCTVEAQPRAALSFSSDALDGALAMAKFSDRRLAALLRMYKYEGVEEAGAALERIWRGWLRRHDGAVRALADGAAVAPVPLHWFRERRRGFNQAERFARALSQESGAPFADGLMMKSFQRRSQATIADDAVRRRNAQDAIRIVPGAAVPGRIMLVDDVITTGATMAACALALKAAGAERVFGLALLRG